MATASDTTSKTMTGGCLCGAIRYTVTGQPFFSCICYCSDCQKVSGAPFMAVLGFTKANFVIDNAEEAVKHIKHNKSIAARGTPKHQSFCQDCGSVVFGGTYGEQEWHTVYSGTLDEGFRDEFPPTFAMFVKDMPKWAKLEGMEEFEKMPPPVSGA